MKKILFCTPVRLQKSLGHTKVIIELSEELATRGWDCDFVCPWDVSGADDADPSRSFASNLKSYLKCHAGDYDVVDFDHGYLPFPRSEFDPKPLLVARSVFLTVHLESITIPTGNSIRAIVGTMVHGKKRRLARQQMVYQAQASLEAADFVNVSNDDDRKELVRRGMKSEKIAVIPYGISRSRRLLFDSVSSLPPQQPSVAFVGTFDYRKGAQDFPRIVKAVAEQVPDVRFCLLGAKGMFQSERDIRRFFPKALADRIDITLNYPPEALPQMLKSCSVGMFPSYLEGFGFGVLEMLAAAVPVIAYDAPGPPMMLPSEYLVRRGDWKGLSQKLITLLQDENNLREARLWARQRSHEFNWSRIAGMTDEIYREKLSQRHKYNTD